MASLSSFTANLPQLPKVEGTEPERSVLDLFRIAIAKRVADALPPLTIEQVYTGVDYGKKGVDFTVALPRFRLPGKVDELAKKVLSEVSHFRASAGCEQPIVTSWAQVVALWFCSLALLMHVHVHYL